jgi:hypothetical protein
MALTDRRPCTSSGAVLALIESHGPKGHTLSYFVYIEDKYLPVRIMNWYLVILTVNVSIGYILYKLAIKENF